MFLCLDTETGGLDEKVHALVEVAWQDPYDEGLKGSLVLPHNPHRVSGAAAAVNGYYERGLNDPENWATPSEITRLHQALQEVTLVGANIAFDERFLKAWGFTGWNYRKLDLASAAVPLVGMVPSRDGKSLVLPGLSDMAQWLQAWGFDVPEPDHTAAADVATTVAVFHGLGAVWGRFRVL